MSSPRALDRQALIDFVRAQPWAVQASVSAGDGGPQAAVIGLVVSDDLELFFDTNIPSRKCQNLRRDGRIALVIGWDQGQTLQLEGVADEPTGPELGRLKALYFARFPDGRTREAWPDITYFRVRPTWARFSDFNGAAPQIQETVFSSER